MNREPSPALILTFIIATALKIVGVLVAMATAYATSGTLAADRWGGALLTGLILLLLVFPYGRWRHGRESYPHAQLMVALFAAIIFQYVDVIISSYVPYEPLAINDRFQLLLGWSLQDVNNVHALGFMFTMVPIVLASWHYGVWGMLLSLGFNAVLYLLLPLALPPDAFNWWFYAVRGFVLLGMTLILAFVVGTLASAQRRRQQELAAANRKLAEQAAVMEQLATSRERNRLARELHDTLAHSLSGTAVQLQAVQTLMNVDVGEASAELKSAQAQIKHGLQEARRAIAALRSAPLEELGLAGALRQRCDILSERLGITIACAIAALPTLPPLAEQTIFRIADEALVNAEKYAQATSICLSLTANDAAVLSVRDNGIGFDPQAVRGAPNHFGILGMYERAALIDGQLTIDSQPGQGTTVTLAVPIGTS